MMPRLRFLAALLALFAFATSLAEAAWAAATCLPGMEVTTAAQAAPATGHGDGEHPAPDHHSSDPGEPGACPFASAASLCGFIAVPTSAVEWQAASTNVVAPSTLRVAPLPDLLGSSFFHPPRA